MEAIQDNAVYAKEADGIPTRAILFGGMERLLGRTPGNLSPQSCTSEKWLAPFTETIRRSRQQHQHPWTLLCPWPSQRSSSPQSKNEDNQQNALRSAPCEATRKKQQGRGNKEEVTRRNPSQCGSRVKSRRVAGDLSSWRGEHRGACSGNLTIGSSTFEELHGTLF